MLSAFSLLMSVQKASTDEESGRSIVTTFGGGGWVLMGGDGHVDRPLFTVKVGFGFQCYWFGLRCFWSKICPPLYLIETDLLKFIASY